MEVRGIWLTNVDSNVLDSQQSIAEAMQFLAATGFNVVFPVVWNKGFTLYPSQVMQEYFDREINPHFQGRDPLAEVITEAHQVGLKVVPWFEYGFACSYRQNGGYILAKKPEWAAINYQGKWVVKNGFDWMNALDFEVQEFMLNLVLEVVKNYDIDGIQGDDRMPALPSEGGYDRKTVERYQLEWQREAPQDCQDPHWLQWRADILTDFLLRLHQEVKAVKPHLLISMSPSPYDWGLREYLQDSKSWVEMNLVDWLHPQLYRRNFWSYKLLIDQLVKKQVSPENLPKIYPGILMKIADYRISIDDLLTIIAYHRFLGIQGEVLFFYEGLRENHQVIAKALKQGPYSVSPSASRLVSRNQNEWQFFLQLWMQRFVKFMH